MRSEALSNMSECPVTEALFGHLRRSPLAGWDWQQARWLKPPSSPLRSRALLQRGMAWRYARYVRALTFLRILAEQS
jgi:hypothetical protein